MCDLTVAHARAVYVATRHVCTHTDTCVRLDSFTCVTWLPHTHMHTVHVATHHVHRDICPNLSHVWHDCLVRIRTQSMLLRTTLLCCYALCCHVPWWLCVSVYTATYVCTHSMMLWGGYVSFVEYRLFYRSLLQKRPIILRSLLIEATPYALCCYAPWCDCVSLCAQRLMRDMTLSHVWHDSFTCVALPPHTHIRSLRCCASMCVHTERQMCDMTLSYVCPWLLPHSYTYAVYIATRHVFTHTHTHTHTCDMTLSCVCYDRFIRILRRTHT